MNTYRDLVLQVQKSIERFCLDFKTQVSAKAYEWLECMDQSIDHDLAELDEQSNQIEIVAAEVSLRR
jgi:hypothetical protein